MSLTINFINADKNEAIESFITSMIKKSFPDRSDINNIVVNLLAQADKRVPWKCTIHVFSDHNNVMTDSQAANYLTAFSQALNRCKRQWDKNSLRA